MRAPTQTAWLLGIFLALGCDGHEGPEPSIGWQMVHEELPGALLSVWGTRSTDVWAVGGDALDGTGPLVLHFDGEGWERVATSEAQGNLWWVFGFEGGPVFAGGDGGVILRYDGATFTRMQTPGTETVFGIWGATPDDVWAVGGASQSAAGFAWRLQGDAWVPEPSLPADVIADSAVWKVFGTATNDAWLVGSNGLAMHWDGATLSPGNTGVGSSLFTVHAAGGEYVAVGGSASGIIVQYDGAQWNNVTPTEPPPGLAGVCLGENGDGVAVGFLGTVYTRDADGWQPEDTGLPVAQDLHAAWIDEIGGIWAVGGETFSYPLVDGVMLHRGVEVPVGL